MEGEGGEKEWRDAGMILEETSKGESLYLYHNLRIALSWMTNNQQQSQNITRNSAASDCVWLKLVTYGLFGYRVRGMLGWGVKILSRSVYILLRSSLDLGWIKVRYRTICGNTWNQLWLFSIWESILQILLILPDCLAAVVVVYCISSHTDCHNKVVPNFTRKIISWASQFPRASRVACIWWINKIKIPTGCSCENK